MADFYALEFVGGPDGTANPPKRLDGRVIGAKERRVRATKPQTALAAGDRLYVGKLPQGAAMRGFSGCFDTSLGSSTISVGTTTNPTKYVNAKTLTATDTPTGLGPKASAIVADPLSVEEDIWVTIGSATIVAGTIGAFEMTYTISA